MIFPFFILLNFTSLQMPMLSNRFSCDVWIFRRREIQVLCEFFCFALGFPPFRIHLAFAIRHTRNLAFSLSRRFVCFLYCECFHWRCRSNNFVLQLAYCTKCLCFANIHNICTNVYVCHLKPNTKHLYTYIHFCFLHNFSFRFFFSFIFNFHLLSPSEFRLCLRLELYLWNGSTAFIIWQVKSI